MTDADQQSAREDVVQDETMMTEITIQPDGRVYVFGTSLPVLELLHGLQPGDAKVRSLLAHLRGVADADATLRSHENQM